MSNDFSWIPLDAEILNQTPPEVLAFILDLISQIEQQKKQNAALKKRIVELGACRTLAKNNAISMFFDEKFLQFSQKIKLLAWIFIKVRQAPRNKTEDEINKLKQTSVK